MDSIRDWQTRHYGTQPQHAYEAYSQHNYRPTPNAVRGRIPPLRHMAEDVLLGAKPQAYEAIGMKQRDKRHKSRPGLDIDFALQHINKLMESDDEFENRHILQRAALRSNA